jgi:excisionase family DNA binding protein
MLASRKVRNPAKEGGSVGEKVLMTIEEVAAYLTVPPGTVLAWRARHIGPKGYRVGKHVRYRQADVDEWLERRADSEKTKVAS